METKFESLVYESDESSGSKGSTMSSRGRRKSSRLSVIKTESLPTRRSGRIQKRQQSTDEDKEKVKKFFDELPRPTKRTKPNAVKQTTFDDQVEKIHGATSKDGELKFYIQLKGEGKPSLVSSNEAKKKYPYHVLDFYESCLIWESEDDNLEDDDDDEDKPLATLKSEA